MERKDVKERQDVRDSQADDNISLGAVVKNSNLYKVVNNRFFLTVLVLILVFLLLFILHQVSWIFEPVKSFIDTIFLPLVFTAIAYYLSVPLVNFLERKGVSRTVGAAIVLGIIIAFFLLIIALIPSWLEEAGNLLMNWSRIWNEYEKQISNIFAADWYKEMTAFVRSHFRLESIDWKDILSTAVNRLSNSISSTVHVTVKVVVSLVTAPFILFFLLKDGSKFGQAAAKLIPNRYRTATVSIFREINQQLSAYIRGQILVCVAVGVMFIIGYNFIGLQYGTVLGVIGGLLNIIPYLGSFIAMVIPIIVAIVDSPMMVVKVLLVFAVEQTIESRVISPLILGSNLNIHPITIMILLLAGGNMFGIVGIIFIIPIYASLKVIVVNIFKWFRQVSGLYDEDIQEEEAAESDAQEAES